MKHHLLRPVFASLAVVALAVPLAVRAVPQERRERHPEIREAIAKLENAKHDLVAEAARDFKGHRAKAVRHIDEAVTELRLALQADKD